MTTNREGAAMQELLAMMAARARCRICGFTRGGCDRLPRPCCEDCTHGRDDSGTIVYVRSEK